MIFLCGNFDNYCGFCCLFLTFAFTVYYLLVRQPNSVKSSKKEFRDEISESVQNISKLKIQIVGART